MCPRSATPFLRTGIQSLPSRINSGQSVINGVILTTLPAASRTSYGPISQGICRSAVASHCSTVQKSSSIAALSQGLFADQAHVTRFTQFELSRFLPDIDHSRFVHNLSEALRRVTPTVDHQRILPRGVPIQNP